MRRRVGVLALATWVLAAGGCGGGGGDDVAPGCASGSQVPGAVREAILDRAGTLATRMEEGRWEEIYEDAATALKAQRSAQEFLTPIAQTVQGLGFPRDLAVSDLFVVRFDERFSHRPQVECQETADEPPDVLFLTRHPVQATLVQRGKVGSDEVYISTLWHGEAGEDGETWKLAGFFAKPATWMGRNWEAWAAQASDERVADRRRNAALLLNVALDLVVPCAWVKPAEVTLLQRRQGRINVSELPVGKVESWEGPSDTFHVQRVNYGLAPDALGIVFRYQADGAIEDSTAQNAYADRLFAFVQEQFPEYREVFSVFSFEAYDPAHPERTFTTSRELE